uniref:Envelope fusion protein n=2 Tax=Lygus hesperus TaxID=30085 RepID=A0A0A9X9P2_LYGHE
MTNYAWAEPYSITRLDHSPGIFFERIGRMKFFNDEYNLITFISLNNLDREFEMVSRYLNYTQSICAEKHSSSEKSITFSLCANELNVIEKQVNTISVEKDDLFSLLAHRSKRGLINGIGTGIKWLFGNPDADDASYFNEQINKLSREEDGVLNVVRDQSQIVTTTIRSFNETISRLNQNEMTLKDNIEVIKTAIRKSLDFNSLHHKDFIQILDEHFSLLSYLTLKLQNELSVLTEAVLFARTGVLHPKILSPKQMLDELQNATQQIPESLRFPFPLIKESTSLILNVIQLSVCFIDNKLMFMIHIPLVVPMEFEYFAVTPLPVKLQNNTFVFIKPNQPYFSVAISRNQFSHLDEIELNKCYKLTHQDIVCKNNNLFSIANIAESCEAQLYFSPQTLPQACDVRIINFHVTIWKKFKYANKWLFVAPSTEAITIGCGKAGAFDLIINGTGVLEVYPPCVVYTKHFVLTPVSFSMQLFREILYHS